MPDPQPRSWALPDPTAPYVEATVVRAQAPASARPGDTAVVHPDGSIDGFVGGQCVETSVGVAAAEALQTGEAVLLRVLPDGTATFPDVDGAKTVVNPCLSGGALEIFLAPRTPQPLVAVIGATPIARALESLLPFVGIRPTDAADSYEGCVGVVVATHGHEEIETVRAALTTDVPYVAVVASPRRGEGLLEEMDLTAEERGRVKTPAGLDIGARTSAEIALSIAAELVEAIRRHGARPARTPSAGPAAPVTVLDPVCGMTVTVTDSTPHLDIDGQTHWFCCPGCRDTFAEQVNGAA